MIQSIQHHLKRESRSNIGLLTRLWCYRHGFLSKKAELYNLKELGPGQYLSDLQNRRVDKINRQYKNILDDKLLFHSVLNSKYGKHLPSIIAVIENGSISNTIGESAAVDSLDELIDNEIDKGVICKPISGRGGKGVFTIGKKNDSYYINTEKISRHRLLSTLRKLDEYLVTERITQAQYSRNIYGNTVNTIRIVTMIDTISDEPFIGAAIHRFGTDRSVPVDNWSSGGLSAGIDVDTGKLTAAARKPVVGQPYFYDYHPDSNSRISGTQLPSWNDVCTTILSIADAVSSYLPYIGWDVVITDHEGSFMLIEGNARTDVDLLQIHEPLLVDQRVRRFYESHGIL